MPLDPLIDNRLRFHRDASFNALRYKQLKKNDLCYCSDSTSGFFRERYGPSFKYYDLKGNYIKDHKILGRIKSLGIPPAWKNVWVCPKDNGHLQATGLDEKGRKQYLYHPEWIKISKENKFNKMIDFGLSLPKIRGKVRYNLNRQKLDKVKVLATVLWLLEHTFIRIGNEEYQRENNSFGLTTLRNRHVSVIGQRIFFAFKGKSGVFSKIAISNPIIAKTIKKCIELPGYQLFQFIDEEGNKHVIDSEDVNLFLKEITEDDFSAKDFRTWGATNLCTNHFYQTGDCEDKKTLEKTILEAIKQAAHRLNNTVSVCRNYYIHPAVIRSYENKILVPHFKNHSKINLKVKGLDWNEYALIELLKKHSFAS